MMLEKHVFWRNICKISDILPSGTVKGTRLLMWRQVEEKYDMIPCRYNICMHMRNQTFFVLSFFGFMLTKLFLHQYQTNFYFAIFVTALYFHLLDLMIYSPKYILVQRRHFSCNRLSVISAEFLLILLSCNCQAIKHPYLKCTIC